LCYTGGEHKEGEEYICEDCEEEECCRDCGNECGECCCDYGNPELARLRDGEEEEEEEEIDVDDRDAPNILPYKKCCVCGERKSCGKYMENDWFCENCAEEEEEELSYDCEVCKKHLYITDMAKCEERELCAECCVGRQGDCDCPVCVDNNCAEEAEEEEEERFVCSVCGKTEPKDVEWNVGAFEDFRGEVICPECAEPTFDDLLGDDRLDFSNPENVAQFTAFVQANFTREEIFPETKPIATSDSISGEVSRELETLQAQNAKLVAENQKLQQQLVAIKSLLHAN